MKASQERSARRGDYASTDPSVEPAEESNVGGETLGTIRGDDEVDGIEEPQPYELVSLNDTIGNTHSYKSSSDISFCYEEDFWSRNTRYVCTSIKLTS